MSSCVFSLLHFTFNNIKFNFHIKKMAMKEIGHATVSWDTFNEDNSYMPSRTIGQIKIAFFSLPFHWWKTENNIEYLFCFFLSIMTKKWNGMNTAGRLISCTDFAWISHPMSNVPIMVTTSCQTVMLTAIGRSKG